MLPHLGTDRSERSGHRWVRRATPVLAAVVLIGASVAFMSYAALAAEVDVRDADDSAVLNLTCHHDDECQEITAEALHTCLHGGECQGITTVAFHTCRHTDGCDQATAFHTCRHGDGCQGATTVAFHPCLHGQCPEGAVRTPA